MGRGCTTVTGAELLRREAGGLLRERVLRQDENTGYWRRLLEEGGFSIILHRATKKVYHTSHERAEIVRIDRTQSLLGTTNKSRCIKRIIRVNCSMVSSAQQVL